MIGIAYAMGAPGGAGGGAAGGGLGPLVPLILMFAIFYFLLIRPQQKKAKEHQEMINNLKKGDRIVSNGGLVGQIVSLDNEFINLEIADRVRVKIGRGYVGGLLKASPQEGGGKKDENKDKGEKDQLKSK